LLPTERARHYRGAILYEMSRTAEGEGDRRRAISLAAEAQTLLPEVAAPAVRQAKLLVADGRPRPARRVIEQAWRTAPHPALAAIWGELGGGIPALELVAWFETLAAHNPNAVESAVALAEAALAAQLWGEARRHLGRALAVAPDAPTPRLCLLTARLEEAEHQDAAKARAWYDRALAAPPDPAYICARCGGEHAEWRALCAHCMSFGTLVWRMPGVASAASLPPLLSVAAPAALLPTPDDLASAGQSAR
jgi:HemY protein